MRTTTQKSAISSRILIADDHEVVREGYVTPLGGQKEYHFVGAAKDGNELLEMIPAVKPDIIITDIKMPGMDGIEATKIITKKYPLIPVIAFTVFDDEHLVLKMLHAGASGYLKKTSPKEELVKAIEAIKKGRNFFCSETTVVLARMIANSTLILKGQFPEVDFTPKEKEIIRYICEEKTNKEIAAKLGVDIRSIETSRDKIQKKIGVNNTAGTVIYAIRSGIYKI